MIRFGLYQIKFAHRYKETNGITVPVGTVCKIVKEDQLLGTGISSVHQKLDRFEYEVGRRVALTYALAKAFPGSENKPTRREAWLAYFDRPRHDNTNFNK